VRVFTEVYAAVILRRELAALHAETADQYIKVCSYMAAGLYVRGDVSEFAEPLCVSPTLCDLSDE